MTITLTKLYQLLSDKIDKDTAEVLTAYIEQTITAEVAEHSLNLATKNDVALSAATLRTDIAGVKSELIKWMFIFWIAQVAATFGFILLFLRK